MRLFLIAGEPSGDLLGAALIAGLRQLCGGPDYGSRAWGGPAMAAEGLASRFLMEELSVMGLAEVLPRVPNLLRRIRETAAAVVAATRPDALITIDSPDFCSARRTNAPAPLCRTSKIIHYVAPSVWAWRPGRAAKMARYPVDHVLALLLFEPPYMRRRRHDLPFCRPSGGRVPSGDPPPRPPPYAPNLISEPEQPVLIAPSRLAPRRGHPAGTDLRRGRAAPALGCGPIWR